MPITNASPENILRYLHAAGTGTKEAMKSATSPRGILEWFVNFFTCGGVRRSNERCFQEVIGKLTTSLLYVNKDAFFDGNKIFLEDVNGCTICLSCGAASENTAPMVIIEVNKNGKTVTDKVDSERFWNVCRMLKLMSRNTYTLKMLPQTEQNERDERLPLTFPPKILVLSLVKGIRIAFYLIKKVC
ncbi:SPI-2 type III secretion system effector PipB [Salmonella enterica]|nr:SPI-2 type III secretion system effector PipB [Salmonella enterica]MCD3024987.1 SPI-2 type III secretion system effector PipB [Salmonella enterica subsp. enterica serovar Enteritidis]